MKPKHDEHKFQLTAQQVKALNLPVFGSFPYLATRVVPALYHLSLLPGSFEPGLLRYIAQRQVAANSCQPVSSSVLMIVSTTRLTGQSSVLMKFHAEAMSRLVSSASASSSKTTRSCKSARGSWLHTSSRGAAPADTSMAT